jgi:hypothetical protein
MARWRKARRHRRTRHENAGVSPFIKLCLALHLLACCCCAGNRHGWPAGLLLVLLHGLIALLGLLPRSTLLGPNLTRCRCRHPPWRSGHHH